MNITFLIGNGFDRNLGLKTAYSDFVKYYKNTEAQTEVLQNFRNYIKDNEELWSAAEIALGQYTSQFEKGEAEAFSECQRDFCEFLAEYLKQEEKCINYKSSKELILKAFAQLNQIPQSFPGQERDTLNTILINNKNVDIVFNFLCFNYTSTLTECLNTVKDNTEIFGTHKHTNRIYNHKIGKVCHVHGTVDKNMVFGVNDDSQIEKNDIFDCEYGDLYKNLLIKVQANASYLENTDFIANQILQYSDLIYVYGMSIGDTDKLWWDRICEWMSRDSRRHVIIQKYSMPSRSVIPVHYQVAERKARREITKHSNLEEDKKNLIEKRIHISNGNMFEAINNIRKDKPLYVEVFEELQAEENLKELEKEFIHV